MRVLQALSGLGRSECLAGSLPTSDERRDSRSPVLRLSAASCTRQGVGASSALFNPCPAYYQGKRAQTIDAGSTLPHNRARAPFTARPEHFENTRSSYRIAYSVLR